VSAFEKESSGRKGVLLPKEQKHLLELLTVFWLSSAARHLVVDRFFPLQFRAMHLKQISHFQRSNLMRQKLL